VAVRVPAHAAARQVIAASGVPWVYTSANKSGRPSLSEPAAVAAELGAEIDVLVDGGASPAAEPTLVDASESSPRVIKVGAVSAEKIREAAA